MKKTILSLSLLSVGAAQAIDFTHEEFEPSVVENIRGDIKPIEVVVIHGLNGMVLNANGTGITFWEESSLELSQLPDGTFTAIETFVSSEKSSFQAKNYSQADAEKIFDKLRGRQK